MQFFENFFNLHRRFFRHFRLIFLFVHCLFRLFFQPIVEVLLFHLEKEIRENQALRLDRFQSFHPKYEISQILEVIFILRKGLLSPIREFWTKNPIFGN